MNVYLTFDIEVWCNGWDDLDGHFASSFERYVYGHSAHGDYAMPKTLEILIQNGLKGVFFVEPLFSARFGLEPLETLVRLIRDAGQEIQLHLHPEWTDEALEPLIENCAAKRQHLSFYTLEEQIQLINHGKRMLQMVGSGPISGFRSGSFAVNRDSFAALDRCGIHLDFSLNRCFGVSAPDLRANNTFDAPFKVDSVSTYPVTIFKDGFGRDRPAQVGACSFSEMRDALQSAKQAGVQDFVIVSHNFELLKQNSVQPDWIVVKRFEQLCAYLAANPQDFKVRGLGNDMHLAANARPQTERRKAAPRADVWATTQRHVEQIQRRLLG